MAYFYANYPALDWLTITTYNSDAFMTIRELLLNNSECLREKAKMGSYRGIRFDDGFSGFGQQKGGDHYINRFEGGIAHDLFPLLLHHVDPNSIKGTRVDLQLTVPMPENYSARTLADHLEAVDWGHRRRNRKRKIRLIDNLGKVNDTVEIGVRKDSNRFARAYIKQDETDNYWLRLEVEYKNDLAPVIFRNLLVQGEELVASYLKDELDRLPRHPYLNPFWQILTDVEALSAAVPKKVIAESATYKWFETAVLPSLYRLLTSKEYQQRTQLHLERLLTLCK